MFSALSTIDILAECGLSAKLQVAIASFTLQRSHDVTGYSAYADIVLSAHLHEEGNNAILKNAGQAEPEMLDASTD